MRLGPTKLIHKATVNLVRKAVGKAARGIQQFQGTMRAIRQTQGSTSDMQRQLHNQRPNKTNFH